MRRAIQDRYPDDFAHCFGCGRLNDRGHQVKTYVGEAGPVTEHEPADYYRGGGEAAYGGIIASLIDCHSAGSAAIFWMQANDQQPGIDESPRFVTARLEVDYIKPTPLGLMRMTGHAEEVGERKVIVTTELSADGQVTARGRAVMVRVQEA